MNKTTGFYIGLKLALNGGGLSDTWSASPRESLVPEVIRGWEYGREIIRNHPKPNTKITTDILYRAMIGITPENHPIAYKILSGLRDNK